MSQHNKFLGTGWTFPPQFCPVRREITLVSDEEDIRQGLTILLSTTPGERIMEPEFGCNIQRFMFAEMTQTTLTEIEYEIERSVLLFESRVDLLAVDLIPEPLEGKLMIELEYKIVTTNIRDNMVYPFYLLEGTLIDDDLLPSAKAVVMREEP